MAREPNYGSQADSGSDPGSVTWPHGKDIHFICQGFYFCKIEKISPRFCPVGCPGRDGDF
jgi:hypothetical protein